MPTLTISDGAAAELRAALSVPAFQGNAPWPSDSSGPLPPYDRGAPVVLVPLQPATPNPSGVQIVEMDWNNPQRLIVGMDAATVVAVRFTTGPNPSPPNNLPHLVAAEYGTSPRNRIATLTTLPGAFWLSLLPPIDASTVTAPFSVGPNDTHYYPALEPNTTYYLNIKNADQSAPGPATIYVDLLKPGGGY